MKPISHRLRGFFYKFNAIRRIAFSLFLLRRDVDIPARVSIASARNSFAKKANLFSFLLSCFLYLRYA